MSKFSKALEKIAEEREKSRQEEARQQNQRVEVSQPDGGKPASEISNSNRYVVLMFSIIAFLVAGALIFKFDVISAVLSPTTQESSTLEKYYTVQLVTYKNRGRAEQEAFRIRKTGHEAFVLNQSGKFVVCVGQYETSDEINSYREQIMNDSKINQFKDAFVRYIDTTK